MISLFSIIALGFFLGMRHATDPDHVVAVATIVSRQRSLVRAALIGAFWGLGHTLTIFVVGAGIILFSVVIPARVGLSMELSVGIMLIILGFLNVASFMRTVPSGDLEQAGGDALVHTHEHRHGDLVHSHSHVHEPAVAMDRMFADSGIYQHLRPLMIGIVHGLAGSAAVALLVLATIRNAHWAIAYLLVFGIGTIAGMMVITMSLVSALKVAGKSPRTARRLGFASGLLSLAFGLFVVYQIGFVNGLFTSHPTWTPK